MKPIEAVLFSLYGGCAGFLLCYILIYFSPKPRNEQNSFIVTLYDYVDRLRAQLITALIGALAAVNILKPTMSFDRVYLLSLIGVLVAFDLLLEVIIKKVRKNLPSADILNPSLPEPENLTPDTEEDENEGSYKSLLNTTDETHDD